MSTSIEVASPPSSPAVARPPTPGPTPAHRRKRWSNAEFDRLVEDGFLREGSSAYLWDGEIIEPMPEKRPHMNAAALLLRLFLARIPEIDWTLDTNSPVALDEGFKPQPDLVVFRGPRSRFRDQTPTPTDVALFIEIADSTYSDDAGDYLRKYAAVGIPQYWIVNIPARRIEVYTTPFTADDGTHGYRDRQDFGVNDRVPLVLNQGDARVEFEAVPVLDVLRDSIEPAAEGGPA